MIYPHDDPAVYARRIVADVLADASLRHPDEAVRLAARAEFAERFQSVADTVCGIAERIRDVRRTIAAAIRPTLEHLSYALAALPTPPEQEDRP